MSLNSVHDCGFSMIPMSFCFRTERSVDGSHSGRLVGSHRDSSRDVADQDAEKCRSSQQKSSAPTLCVGKTAKRDEAEKVKELPPILKYIKTQVRKCGMAIAGT